MYQTVDSLFHIKNSVIEVTETMNTDTMRIGALVGQASQSIISYCSASNVNFTTISCKGVF